LNDLAEIIYVPDKISQKINVAEGQQGKPPGDVPFPHREKLFFS
jgi:hypothetical protein